MISMRKALATSVGRKFVMALSGLALIGFLVVHLSGNLALLAPSGDKFNKYAHLLQSFGLLLQVASWGLFAMFVIHILNGIGLTWKNKTARPARYAKSASKGGPSKSNLGSRNMIVSGLVLAVFWIKHLIQFKWGPGIEKGYVTTIDGVQMRDLYKLVSEEFHEPFEVGFYTVVMLFLGFHLRHAFWSAFQSIGAMKSKWSPILYGIGVALAVALTIGFILLPSWIYFDLGRMFQ